MAPIRLFYYITAALAISSLPAVADDSADHEAAFVAMLTNATLEGTWVPVRQGKAGEQKTDRYRVARAEKIDGDRWRIISKVKHQGQEIEVPIEVIVKWAGDTAVMLLDEVQTGGGKSYSARVLFHNNRYAGSWWGADQPGGLVSGAITQGEDQ